MTISSLPVLLLRGAGILSTYSGINTLTWEAFSSETSLTFAILYGDFHGRLLGALEAQEWIFFMEIVLVIASGSRDSRNSPSSKCIEYSSQRRSSTFCFPMSRVSCVIYFSFLSVHMLYSVFIKKNEVLWGNSPTVFPSKN